MVESFYVQKRRVGMDIDDLEEVLLARHPEVQSATMFQLCSSSKFLREEDAQHVLSDMVEKEQDLSQRNNLKNWVIGVLAVALVFLSSSYGSRGGEIKKLRDDVATYRNIASTRGQAGYECLKAIYDLPPSLPFTVQDPETSYEDLQRSLALSYAVNVLCEAKLAQ